MNKTKSKQKSCSEIAWLYKSKGHIMRAGSPYATKSVDMQFRDFDRYSQGQKVQEKIPHIAVS